MLPGERVKSSFKSYFIFASIRLFVMPADNNVQVRFRQGDDKIDVCIIEDLERISHNFLYINEAWLAWLACVYTHMLR